MNSKYTRKEAFALYLIVFGILYFAYLAPTLHLPYSLPFATPEGVYTCNNQSSICTPLSATILITSPPTGNYGYPAFNFTCQTSPYQFQYAAFAGSVLWTVLGQGKATTGPAQGFIAQQSTTLIGGLNYTYLGIQNSNPNYIAKGDICFFQLPALSSNGVINVWFYQVKNGQQQLIGIQQFGTASGSTAFIGLGINPASLPIKPLITYSASNGVINGAGFTPNGAAGIFINGNPTQQSQVSVSSTGTLAWGTAGFFSSGTQLYVKDLTTGVQSNLITIGTSSTSTTVQSTSTLTTTAITTQSTSTTVSSTTTSTAGTTTPTTTVMCTTNCGGSSYPISTWLIANFPQFFNSSGPIIQFLQSLGL